MCCDKINHCKFRSATPAWIWCVKYMTESHSRQSLLCGLGSGQLSLSDVMALRGPLHTWEEVELVRSGGEKEEKSCLNKKANAHWHFGSERGGCGCVMYLLSRC